MKTNKRLRVFAYTCEQQVHVFYSRGIPLDPGPDFSERIGNRNLLRRAVIIVLASAKCKTMCPWTMALPWTRELMSVNG